MPVNAKANELDGLRTYSSIGGCDIITVMNGNECGSLQSISVSTSREKGPLYTMGVADPIGYSRGKRAVAGSMTGIAFNKSWLMDVIQGEGKESNQTVFWASRREYRQFLRITARDQNVEENFRSIDDIGGTPVKFYTGRTRQKAWYADQVLPFNIVITGANEYGGGMAMSIIGAEILNEATGVSVDDIMTDESHTYIALGKTPWMSLGFISPRTNVESAPETALQDILGKAGLAEARSILDNA